MDWDCALTNPATTMCCCRSGSVLLACKLSGIWALKFWCLPVVFSLLKNLEWVKFCNKWRTVLWFTFVFTQFWGFKKKEAHFKFAICTYPEVVYNTGDLYLLAVKTDFSQYVSFCGNTNISRCTVTNKISIAMKSWLILALHCCCCTLNVWLQ